MPHFEDRHPVHRYPDVGFALPSAALLVGIFFAITARYMTLTIPCRRGAPLIKPLEMDLCICMFGRRLAQGAYRMATTHEFWRERLEAPAYRIGEAARYAKLSPQTVTAWQRNSVTDSVLSEHRQGKPLSYLQLIEVGVVAALRKAGVKLSVIRESREYLTDRFGTKYPFATRNFKTDGADVLLSDSDLFGGSDKSHLVAASLAGQLVWGEMLHELLVTFSYDEDTDTVLEWKLDGLDSPVTVDPRIAFGAPQVSGVSTRVLRERWNSGESINDIADDYGLCREKVARALSFERIVIDYTRENLWKN